MKDLSGTRIGLNNAMASVAEIVLRDGIDGFMNGIDADYLTDYTLSNCPYVAEYLKTHKTEGTILNVNNGEKCCSECGYFRKRDGKCSQHTLVPIYNPDETTCNCFRER